ncbi:hypothetical protein EDB80DRAFT_458555 [Ilyonectria destructans]|nr:hypothetical protein EDB80DRAFT_458555 [Ilyonectria destructans]
MSYSCHKPLLATALVECAFPFASASDATEHESNKHANNLSATPSGRRGTTLPTIYHLNLTCWCRNATGLT